MSDDKNIHFAAYGAAIPSYTLTVQDSKFGNFVRGEYGNMFLAFGKTAPQGLRTMADGLESEGVFDIDGLSVNYDADANVDDYYCITAFVHQAPSEEES